ncbi:MAG TPA: hypothetical protein VIC71_02465 [Gammaproteobacteria bacterium]|jgi:hypothetical protein
MSEDRDGLFRQLEPPPGGVERFRARLDAAAERDRGPPWRLAVAVAAGLVVVVATLVVLNDVGRSGSAENRVAAAPEFDRLLGRPLNHVEPAVTLNDQPVILAAVQSDNPKVRIYQIQ